MALLLNVSSSLRQLARAFTNDLSSRTKGVFEPDYVVTQTEGMNTYLRLQLAQETGLSAHCRYLGPTELILQAHRLIVPDARASISVPQLRWQVYKLLAEDTFIDRFPQVAGYYQTTDADRDLKRLELAEKVATLFDQYQLYRPALIREWNRPIESTTDWQRYLWQQVKRRAEHRASDKTHISDSLLEALKIPENQDLLRRKMAAVYVFGISIITDYHVGLLKALSQVINIHLYLLDPAAGVYWYDDRSEKQLVALKSKGVDTGHMEEGNPLLVSWGRVVQDTFKLLFKHEVFLNAYEVLDDVARPLPQTLLGKIQADLHTAAGRTSRNPIHPTDLQDGSLTVAACYTPLREVEALYNYLVDLQVQGTRFAPQDVLVMVNDINVYAPYIKAVFQNAPYPFRYTLTDENPSGGDSFIDALAALLQLNAENFKPEEVVQLLEFSAIQQRFGIEDAGLVRRLINDANIRFGFDGSPEDDTRFVSWRYGLQRIVYGVCMQGEDACTTLSGEVLEPLDRVEGREAQLAIRFAYFAETLMQYLEERHRSRSIAEWVTYIERLIHDLLADTSEDVEEEIHDILNQLGSFNTAYEYMTEPMSYEVFSRSFLQSLRTIVQEKSYGYGGITFCSMIPMRSIPFRIIAMLGLDQDKFPRKETPLSFNLINQQRQTGDRNLRDNDRHLFLETLLSADERLYLSYMGRRTSDNSPVPPSALVEELLDYIEAGMEPRTFDRTAFVTVHPLHSFSGKYNLPETRLKDYLRRSQAQPEPWTREPEEPEIHTYDIPLRGLVQFPRNALRHWYQHRLGIHYQDAEVALPDTERLDIDPLLASQLKRTILLQSADQLEALRQTQVRTGVLPLSSLSVVVMETLKDELATLKPLVQQHGLLEPEQSVPIVLTLEEGRVLKGTLQVLEGHRMVYICLSKNETPHRIQALVEYYAGVASGMARSMTFISGPTENVQELAPVTADEALQKLREMTRLYLHGKTAPLAFTAELIKHLRKEIDQLDTEHLVIIAGKAAEGYDYTPDPYLCQYHRQGLFSTPEALKGFQAMYRAFAADLKRFFPEK
ncbi:MAG: exodeoxyribonuclease V subunit gamma [Sphingobacteriales bacterium]|nr:MAG: exodeoxyribonuclease V subunit gamma [Sphingobacteriales bacterium]